MRSTVIFSLFLVLTIPFMTGCGSFMARRMAQAPNTYPAWLAPAAPVHLKFEANYLTNFPLRYVDVGPPHARLAYRVIAPADYHLRVTSAYSTNRSGAHHTFSFRAVVPGTTNAWTATPCGTVVLLHGYGVGQFAMFPWALQLAQEGWRCVLPDLRGHGTSTGRRIYFGLHEPADMKQLLNQLAAEGRLTPPVAAIGESYGAAIALRWQAMDARLHSVVAMSPFPQLSNVVMNICREYAPWFPAGCIRAGLRELPGLFDVESQQLDSISALRPDVNVLFVAGSADKITPPADVSTLAQAAGTDSRLVLVEGATHEALPYYFDQLLPEILRWINHSRESEE